MTPSNYTLGPKRLAALQAAAIMSCVPGLLRQELTDVQQLDAICSILSSIFESNRTISIHLNPFANNRECYTS